MERRSKAVSRRKVVADGSTEEKIKEAARKLFTEKGFDAVKTRDIAAEAGINLALLNYYFRSKEKLFDIVMIENFERFVQQLIPVFGDERLTIDERLTQIVGRYIDMLDKNPNLPFFIMNAMKSDSSKLLQVREKMMGVREAFLNQLGLSMKEGKASQVNIVHFMMNFMGLMIFPFISKPMLMRVNGISEKQFEGLMEERKVLIPIWLKAIMKTK